MPLKTVKPQRVENGAVSKRSYSEFDWQSDQFRPGALFSNHKIDESGLHVVSKISLLWEMMG